MICYYFLFQRLLKSSKSKRLEKQGIEVKGPLRSINQWIDMSKRNVALKNGTQVKTCSPALGKDYYIDGQNTQLIFLKKMSTRGGN